MGWPPFLFAFLPYADVMTARTPAMLLFTSILLIALVYIVSIFHAPTPATNVLLAIGISGASTSVMAFGLPQRSRRGRSIVAVTLGLTFLLTAAGFIFALRAAAPNAQTRLLLGLPAGAAAIIYGVGMLPLIVLPIVYAFTYEDTRPQ